MTNIFENTRASWVRYSDYEWRTAENGKDYTRFPFSNDSFHGRMILAVAGDPDYSGILPPFSQLP
ncbi:MAG: hypothetical protein IJ206_03495 [Oscillospiraceae bacterium]|nr:hypothetical protein [Oscillospiraceae bacterium]